MSFPYGVSRRVNKTRKPHRCIWCGGTIEQGKPASRMAGINEGDFWSGCMHVECHYAAEAVAKEDGCWEADENYARGRMDDDTSKPPEFPREWSKA